MVLGRFKDAVTDVAETIRRAFQAPPCRTVSTGLSLPGTTSVGLLESVGREVDYAFKPGIEVQDLQFRAVNQGERMSFEGRLCREDGWTAWAAGAKVCEMAVFRAGNCGRLTVPPLPRTAPVRAASLPVFRCGSSSIREPIVWPVARGLSPRLSPPKVRRDLEGVLGLPIAIAGEDFQKLPRALNMRYTFQLVKATGENIRNLEVLGVYMVPVKGVAALSHDARTGRLLVNLGPEAAEAPRRRFLLARKKDDRSFVSCFVEE